MCRVKHWHITHPVPRTPTSCSLGSCTGVSCTFCFCPVVSHKSDHNINPSLISRFHHADFIIFTTPCMHARHVYTARLKVGAVKWHIDCERNIWYISQNCSTCGFVQVGDQPPSILCKRPCLPPPPPPLQSLCTVHCLWAVYRVFAIPVVAPSGILSAM